MVVRHATYVRVSQGIFVAPTVFIAGLAVLFLFTDEFGILPPTTLPLLLVIGCGMIGLGALILSLCSNEDTETPLRRAQIILGLVIGLVASVAISMRFGMIGALISVAPVIVAIWHIRLRLPFLVAAQRRRWLFAGGTAIACALLFTSNPVYRYLFGAPISGYSSPSILAAELAAALSQKSLVNLSNLQGAAHDSASRGGAFGFDWDRVFFFLPYTPRSEVERRLGASPGLGWHTTTTSNDGATLIVFMNQGHVETYFDFPSSAGDLSALAQRKTGFARAEAVFQVSHSPDGPPVARPTEPRP